MIVSFLLSFSANGQVINDFKTLKGKVFVSKSLQYLEVLNDSTIFSSINSYNDTARFFLKHDTLFVKEHYYLTGGKKVDKIYSYRIIYYSADTLQLEDDYTNDTKPGDRKSSFLFIDIEKLKEPVAEFKLLVLKYENPFSGKRYISIDSVGRVSFDDRPIEYRINHPEGDKNARPKNISGMLSKKEFSHFKSVLSKSLPLRLPSRRACGLDGAISDFEIKIGEKTIRSTGCRLSWVHAFLFNYVYEIDRNKGLIKDKK